MVFARINGQELFFEDSGGDGEPIVMMHGFLMDQSLFDPQVKALAPTYRCIRFDARAFGQTQWDGKAFNLYDTVSDCVGLMDHLGIKQATIVGMSQGGYAALRMALTNPERIKALVLMSTWGGADDETTKMHFRQTRDTWAAVGPVEPLMEGLATVLLGPKEAPGMSEHWATWLPKWRNRSANAITHAMNNLLDRDDISPRLSEIAHPTLVTHGDSDFGMPMVLAEQLSRALPNAKDFVVVAGGAHAANFTHPESVNKAIANFLAEQ